MSTEPRLVLTTVFALLNRLVLLRCAGATAGDARQRVDGLDHWRLRRAGLEAVHVGKRVSHDLTFDLRVPAVDD
jgi:hypothetical protein